jgi:hypothetical protein
VTVKVSDDLFVSTWQRLGSPDAVALELGLQVRGLYQRRARLAKKGIYLPTNSTSTRPNTEWTPRLEFERQRKFEVGTGTVIIFSDPHWLPDHRPASMQALLTLCKELKPQAVFCGGDAVDGDTISRWDPTRGHHKRFTVREELDTVKEHFTALDNVLGKTPRGWVLGNHDARLSRFVITKAPELSDMPGMRLEDWAPRWPLSWTIAINAGTEGMLVLRHRNQAGMLHLQAQKAGCHYAHGHLHNMNDNGKPTFAGTRYSIDCGSLADPDSEGFDYMEGNIPHVTGFAVLTYQAGMLLKPEFCYMQRGEMWFRGGRVA